MFSAQQKLFFGLIAVLGVAGVLAFYVCRLPGEQMERGEWVVHTHQVLNRLSLLSGDLTEARAVQRDYVIGQDQETYRAYLVSTSRVGEDIDAFELLTADNAAQKSQIPALRDAVHALFASLENRMSMRPTFLPDSQMAALLKEHTTQLAAAVEIIHRLQAEEESLLAERTRGWNDTVSRVRLILLSGVLLLVALLVAIYRALRNEALSRRRLQQVVALQQEVVSHRLHLQKAMQVIAERTQHITKADGAIVELTEGGDMVYHAVCGTASPHLGFRLPAASSLSGQCVRERIPLKCDDSNTDDRVNSDACKKIGLRSMIVVPLLHHESTLGVLKVTSQKVHAFSESDVAVLELMAGVLSATISDAAAATELQIINDKLSEANRQLQEQKSQLQYDNQQLEEMAATDGLTGLKNHRYFKNCLQDEYYRAKRYDTPLSVILIDVDHFKRFNDTYGHTAGDMVLQKVAGLLKKTARSIDCVARYGGEEFGLILPQTDRAGALVVAERLRLHVSRLSWENTCITISIGVSNLQAATSLPATLFEHADAALYRAKDAGRNCVVASEPDDVA